MSFDRMMADTVRRYLRDKYGYEPNLAELLREPRHKRVWAWWTALAHFGEDNVYERIEAMPDGREYVAVMDGVSKRTYTWVDGEYVFSQEITEAECKAIYGTG